MKQIFLSIVLSISALNGLYPQNIINEHFNYPAGTLTEVSDYWIENPAGSYDVQVIPGSLSYYKYASSDTGNCIFLDSDAVNRSGVQRSVSSGLNTIYISFLISVKDTLDLMSHTSTGTFFFDLVGDYDQSRSLIWIRKSANRGMINLGVSKVLTTFTYSPTDYKVTDTLLLVLKYRIFGSSTTNDTVSLWINPPLSENEPMPDALHFTGSDLTVIKGMRFRQTANSGNIYVDGLRVSPTWGQAPLPVQLSSFTAVNKDGKNILDWKTDTELFNYGFDIERKISSNYKNEDWKVIGSMPGYGNSNSPKYYTFSDNEVYNFCNYAYRLKQINTDGTFIYYDQVELNINIPGKFCLFQNYPNPFNPTTTISFSVSEDDQTRISLYNLTGEKLAELYNKYTLAGDYKIEYNAEDLSSGTYFCLLESGNKRRVIKIVILR
jgi:hypothetical protein